MNYSYTLSRAWELVWRHKVLWALGLIAGLFVGNSSGGNRFVQGGAWLFQNLPGLFTNGTEIGELLLLASLVLWPLGLLARIGLIREVWALNRKRGKSTGHLGQSFRESACYLMPVILMQLLLWSPILLLSLSTMAVSATIEPIGIEQLQFNEYVIENIPRIGGSLLFTCTGALLTIPLGLVEAFAFRGIVLQEHTVVESIKGSARLVRNNLGPILTLVVMIVLMGAVFAVLLGVVMSPLLILFARTAFQEMSRCNALGMDSRAAYDCMVQFGTGRTVVLFSLGSTVLGAVLSSVWVAFQSAVFTVGYKKLTGQR